MLINNRIEQIKYENEQKRLEEEERLRRLKMKPTTKESKSKVMRFIKTAFVDYDTLKKRV